MWEMIERMASDRLWISHSLAFFFFFIWSILPVPGLKILEWQCGQYASLMLFRISQQYVGVGLGYKMIQCLANKISRYEKKKD